MKTIDELNDKSAILFLEKIWNYYSKYSGLELSKITHKKGTTWHDVWHDDEKQNDFDVVIDEADISRYYDQRIQKSRNTT